MEIPEHLMKQLDVLINKNIDVKLSYDRCIVTAGIHINIDKRELYQLGRHITCTFTDAVEGSNSLLSKIVNLHYNSWKHTVEENQVYKCPIDTWGGLYTMFELPWKLGFQHWGK